MPTSDRADPLLQALDGLSALGTDHDLEVIGALRSRLADQRLRVLVAGEAKRGKSTLVNALLGRAVLPTGVTPLTALATTVRHGGHEQVTAVSPDGHAQVYPLSALDDLVTERGNPANARNLSSVTVWVDAPLLAMGAELVDTPGTGSVYGHNTQDAQAALRTMDAAVFVLTADPPVSASERDLITQVAQLSAAMFIVLNKADRLSGGDLAEVLDFTADVVARAAGHRLRVYPVSARAALAGPGDAGFAAFETDFTSYLQRERLSDLRRSAADQARRIALSLRDEALVARTAAQMRDAEAAARVQAFATRLGNVRERRREAADLVTAESRRMLADLNDAADRAGRERARHVGRQLDDLLGGTLATASATEIERGGRAKLGDLAVAEAEDWRGERTSVLEAGLARLDQKLTDTLLAELDAVRQAAADLLGLDLAVAPPGERLTPDLRFFYPVADQAGQTELLAGAIRRRLPGEAGRARAREHLRRESADLVPRLIGRARADLQYRLAEAGWRLVRSVDDRYLEGTSRLEKALAHADDLRHAGADEAAARHLELAGRLEAINHALALLGSDPQAGQVTAADAGSAAASAP